MNYTNCRLPEPLALKIDLGRRDPSRLRESLLQQKSACEMGRSAPKLTPSGCSIARWATMVAKPDKGKHHWLEAPNWGGREARDVLSWIGIICVANLFRFPTSLLLSILARLAIAIQLANDAVNLTDSILIYIMTTVSV